MFDISARLKTFCACFSGDAPAKTCTRMSIHWSCRVWNSGVTTMGSDRATPGAPNPNRPNGGHKAQAIEQKHRPGRPLICYNVVFWPSEFSDHQNSVKSLPKSKRWHFRESRFKSFRVRICPGPLENSCIYGAQLVPLALPLGGPSKILNRGPLDITLRHWCEKLWPRGIKAWLFPKRVR
jgi:hypothetical protein